MKDEGGRRKDEGLKANQRSKWFAASSFILPPSSLSFLEVIG
jgi:hypothetical protein